MQWKNVSLRCIFLIALCATSCVVQKNRELFPVMTITPSGWRDSEDGDSAAPLVCLHGDAPVVRYWESGLGGRDDTVFTLLVAGRSLDTFWNRSLFRRGFEKPATDFRVSQLLFIEPGWSHPNFRYSIRAIERADFVEFTVCNFRCKWQRRLRPTLFPVFAFELQGNTKPVKVIFDMDRRCQGIWRNCPF